MKHRQIVSLTIGVFMTITVSVEAQVTILSDDFESGALSQWTGQNGGSTSGFITTDPLDASNHVLTFAAVTFGGTPAISVTVLSATTVIAQSPAHAVGAVDLMVQTADGGTVTSAGGYTYVEEAQPANGDNNG